MIEFIVIGSICLIANLLYIYFILKNLISIHKCKIEIEKEYESKKEEFVESRIVEMKETIKEKEEYIKCLKERINEIKGGN